jgi:hypothetical protein
VNAGEVRLYYESYKSIKEIIAGEGEEYIVPPASNLAYPK